MKRIFFAPFFETSEQYFIGDVVGIGHSGFWRNKSGIAIFRTKYLKLSVLNGEMHKKGIE